MRTGLRSMLTVGALAAALSGAVFTGTASASTVLAQGCTGSVVGNIGDEIAVQGKDLAGLVETGAKEQEAFLHLNGVDPAGLADAITKRGALSVGTVPNASNVSITGDNVATAVTDALQTAAGLGASDDQKHKTLNAISNKVAGNCEMTVYAGNYSAPALPSSGTVPPLTTPATPPGTGAVSAPPRDYGNIPAAVPGVAVAPGARYPAGPPIAGLPTPQIIGGEPAVQNAGQADAIATDPAGGNAVQFPMLLAVVALAAVSAALVRTWVLRKLS
ncbi:hypothetical protein [Amycolatopsis pithecellobii]|uniref:Uncharacterized protein n=1 Tax=Amycolatopsis pithecellobii TaxID=664692 RepID=A0A6N7ZAC9_9PSEU|nr:hypothetical protein [Amycolatopsis pithecellobii]MTD58695.1 hypothetical protein [Amycolatopsis pithecellobii]